MILYNGCCVEGDITYMGSSKGEWGGGGGGGGV